MSNFLEIITQKLAKNDFSHVLKDVKDAKNESEFKRYMWELIPMFFKNINVETVKRNNGLRICCEQLLEVIALKAEPEEVVLEFLEQMDNADSIKFSLILRLLSISLHRCSQNKMRYIETSLVSIRSCLEDLIVSDSDFMVEEEYEEELNDKLRATALVLNSVIAFHTKFISFIVNKNPAYNTEVMVNLFLSRLLQVFDIFLPVDAEHLQPLNDAQLQILRLIARLLDDPFYLLQFIFLRNVRQQNNSTKKEKFDYETDNLRTVCDNIGTEQSTEDLSVFESEFIISNLAYAVYFHSILCTETTKGVRIPCVYNPKYVFLALAPLAIPFLEKDFNKYVMKGLNFLQTLLNLLHNVKLERTELYFQYHDKILTQLNNIMVYCQDQNARKLATLCFKKYIEIFDYEAKYLLFINFRPRVEHSGTLGLLITQFKDYISHYLDTESCEQYGKYYSGKLLFDIIVEYCYLARREKTNLVQTADQVISSLNMLRFVILKDKKDKTGMRKYLTEIRNGFLDPLKTGIELSKEFYKVRLEECKSQVSTKKKVELTVNGQLFENLNKEQQESILYTSLNAIDLIDSLSSRVQECINNIC